MRYVLLTRTIEENLKLSQEIGKKGIKTCSWPLLQLNELATNWVNFSHYSYVAITSKFAATLAAKNITSNVNAFVVGNYSAQILAQSPYIKILAVFNNAEELSRYLSQYFLSKSQENIAYIAGDIIKMELPVFVDKYTVYNTTYDAKMPQHLMQKIIDMEIGILMLYSKNVARAFLELCEKHNIIKYLKAMSVITLSLEIHDSVVKYFDYAFYCNEPSNECMLKLLYNNYAKHL